MVRRKAESNISHTRTKSSSSSSRLKRKEKWLVVLGVVLHFVYLFGIFDIYFRSSIVHGMDPVKPRFDAPAKRLVLLVADGLRADKFFEPDSDGNYRAPFLRNVMKNKGRWGVSHARLPTETRPCHAAMVSGLYEDPDDMFRGWTDEPIEFDSVFNRSRHVFCYGSPAVVPIFCKAVPHSTSNTYSHELEDFAATDASFLDEWSFDQLQSLFNQSKEDPKLKELLAQDELVIFLHLVGCDLNGHAHRPFSSIYLNNVKVVDHIAERVYNLLEDYFKDNRTSYIFTADHGMHDKGSHGDGHTSNTRTPFVAWGAGVKYPKSALHKEHSKNDHAHDTLTPTEWGLNGNERVDVNQADIAPFMSTLLGLSCPVNSVGSLPLDYIEFDEAQEVEAVVANSKQILNHFLQKSHTKQSNSFHFKPFEPLGRYSSILDQIEDLISVKDYKAAMKLADNLRSLALEGLHYLQTYNWLMLTTIITLGYIGWIIFLVLHVLQSYTSIPGDIYTKEQAVQQKLNTKKVYICGILFMGVLSVILSLEHSPLIYYAYVAMAVFLWTRIISEGRLIKGIWKYLSGRKSKYITELIAMSAFAIFILENLVNSMTDRKLYTWCFFLFGCISASYLKSIVPDRLGVPFFVFISFGFLSVFTLMPTEIPHINNLVIASGAMIIIIGLVARWLDQRAHGNRFWLSICNHEKQKPRFPTIFHLQTTLVGLSSIMVFISTSYLKQNQELNTFHQKINWSIAGFSLVLPLFSGNGLLSRLNSIFLGFAPTFLLLSIGYEAVFYGALSLALMSWILFENSLLYAKKAKKINTFVRNLEKHDRENDVRYLQLSDMRIPLAFMVLYNFSFFGAGNFASVASFENSSVFRLVTLYDPLLMTALILFKLFLSYMLVMCAFSAITKILRVPRVGCFFLIIIFYNVMIIRFFFLVKNTGSWMEIGNSINHFVLMNLQVVTVLLLFGLTNIYTKDIQVKQRSSLSWHQCSRL